MSDSLFRIFFVLLPKNVVSRLVGRIVALERPKWLVQRAIAAFQDHYQIDMNEAELPLSSYPSIAALFTRQLKPGLRPIGVEPVHPADAVLTSAQKVVDGFLLQAKGLNYSYADCFQTSAEPDQETWVLTYYLCPTDYHRVHSPVSGQIRRVIHVSGELWPVNAISVRSVSRLFARNERVIVEIESTKGLVRVALVGATNVGQISISSVPSLRGNSGRLAAPRVYDVNQAVRAGDLLGVFHMGSTALVALPGAWIEPGRIQAPTSTRMGQSLIQNQPHRSQ